MTGRRAVIGLSLLCALVFCAFAAPNAMALKGTTAYTCLQSPVKPIGEPFSDAHCTTTSGSGSFRHELIPAGATNLEVSNDETGTKSALLLRGELGGTKAELTAENFTTNKCGATLENKVNAAKQMEAAGVNCGEFTKITVLKPEKCEAKTVTLGKGTQNSVVEEKEKKETMYMNFVGEGAKKVFAKIPLEGKECSLNGKTLEVVGTAHANMSTEDMDKNGATLRFTTAETEKTLSIGGKPAAFQGTFTVRMEGGNPITLTTEPT